MQIKNRLEAGLGFLSSIIANKTKVTEEEIVEMNKISNSFLQVFKRKRKLIEMDEENKEPVNKNIDKQKRFGGKKKKVESLTGRIENNEKQYLKAGLVLEEVLEVHTAYDHTYQ